jgi:hypothetical protein
VCVILCTVFRLIVDLFCVMYVVCMLCLIVVPLPPGENPFAVKIDNNKNKIWKPKQQVHIVHLCGKIGNGPSRQ